MRLWHLLVRQVPKSDNPENLIILKILVQTTVRGQSRVCKVFVQVMNWKDVYSFTKKWYPFLINYEHKL